MLIPCVCRELAAWASVSGVSGGGRSNGMQRPDDGAGIGHDSQHASLVGHCRCEPRISALYWRLSGPASE